MFDLGFRDWGFGLRAKGRGFEGLRVKGLGFRVQGLEPCTNTMGLEAEAEATSATSYTSRTPSLVTKWEDVLVIAGSRVVGLACAADRLLCG